jgi:hypothetical protein
VAVLDPQGREERQQLLIRRVPAGHTDACTGAQADALYEAEARGA